MRRILIPVLLLLGCAPAFADDCCCPQSCCPDNCDECDCQVVSHTFFTSQPQFRLGSPEYISAFRDRTQAREDGHGGALQFIALAGRSLSPQKLAMFFGPSCKTQWVVKEKEVALESDESIGPRLDADIRAHLFNIFTKNGDFESRIRFCPRQSVFGIGMELKQEFARNEDKNTCWWFAVSAPLLHIKNTMGFYEKIISDGGGAISDKTVGSMAAAFSQSSWNCGKIASCSPCCKTTCCTPSTCNNCSSSCCSDNDNCASVNNCYNMTRTRLADIDVRIGYDWVNNETCKLDAYWGVLIPTGNKATSRMLFSPVVGNGQHFGFSHGNTMTMEFWRSEEKDDRYLQMAFDIHGYYLFKHGECRLVDLKGKPWSRYMPVFKDKAQAQEAASSVANKYLHTPGVNVFCRELCVNPGFQCTANGALIFNSGNFQVEGGFNCFCREAECIQCGKCPWKEGPALKDVSFQTQRDGTGFDDLTNRAQLLNEDFSLEYALIAHYDNNLIKGSDLDYQSAAHPAMLTHTFYGSLSYRWDEREYHPIVAIGGSSESGRGNAVMDRWTLWLKAGFSY